jgi:hypothetical protein
MLVCRRSCTTHRHGLDWFTYVLLKEQRAVQI